MYGSKIKISVRSTSRRRKLLDKVLEECRSAGEKLIPREGGKGLRRARKSTLVEAQCVLSREIPRFLRVDPQSPLLLRSSPPLSLQRSRSPLLVSRYLDRCFRVTPAPAFRITPLPLFTVTFKRTPAPHTPCSSFLSRTKFLENTRSLPLLSPVEISSRRCRIVYRGLDFRLNVSFRIYSGGLRCGGKFSIFFFFCSLRRYVVSCSCCNSLRWCI